MITKKLFFILLLPFISCQNVPFDTSTPERFVEAMGQISQHDKPSNPLPYFYEEESATAIGKFDAMGEKVQLAFDTFKNLIATKFPNHTKRNVKGELKIALDGYAGMKIRNFSYSASLIGAQLKKRKASDYEFVSATAPDENGIVQLTLKIIGDEKTLPIKKIDDCYKMFLPNEVIDNIYDSVKTLEQLDQVFSVINEQLKSGQITEENFQEKMEIVSNNYERALN